MKTSFFRLTYLGLIVLSILSLSITAHADFVVDGNNGTFTLDINNGIGTDPSAPFQNNITISGGVATLSGAGSGVFTTVDIAPASFAAWDEIDLSSVAAVAGDVRVQLIECGVGTINPLPGFGTPVTPVGGIIDISSVDPVAYPCIRAHILLQNQSATFPVVDELVVSWVPLPVFLIGLTCAETEVVGERVSYAVDYSVSFVDSPQTVVWLPLPEATTSYGQDADAIFVQATQGGQYTATATVIGGTAIPANSVYWDLGAVSSGTSGTLRAIVRSSNGLETGTIWSAQAFINSPSGELVSSDSDTMAAGDQECPTELTSIPVPIIDKKVNGAVPFGGNVVFNDGASLDGIVTYSIEIRNNAGNTEGEAIFDPVITDSLANIFAILSDTSASGCSVASPATKVLNISAPGALDTTAGSERIVWDFTGDHLNPRGTRTVSFDIDFNDCLNKPVADGTVVPNSATFTGDNVTPTSDDENVTFGLDTTPSGAYAKGDKIDGVSGIRAGADDNKEETILYNEVFSYLLYEVNKGIVNTYDHVFIDKIPDGVNFLDASLPSDLKGFVYYTTATGVGFDDENTPPAFDETAAPAAHGTWQRLDLSPPADPSDVTWVAFYVPCLSSTLASFPPAAGTQCEDVPGSITAEIQVQVMNPSDPDFPGTDTPLECSSFTVQNVAHFTTRNAHSNISNDDTSIVPSSLSFTSTTEIELVTPTIGILSQQNTTITGDSITAVGGTASYVLSIENEGSDILQDATATIFVPTINVNGTPTQLTLSSVTGGTPDFTDLPNGFFTINVGSIPPGPAFKKDVNFSFSIPNGIFDGEGFNVNASVSGTDPQNCTTNSQSPSISTVVEAVALLRVFKERDEAIIDNGDPIHYSLFFTNTGNSPTRSSYIVDVLPPNARLDFAYTSPATDPNGNTFDCTGCIVYFSIANPSLPAALTPTAPFTNGIIQSNFIQGIEVNPGDGTTPQPGSGVWIPDPGYATPSEIRYVAYLVDDPSFSPSLIPAGDTGSVGMRVINDEDGSGAGTAGSADGSLIVNSAATLTEDLLQAIGNEVRTTILADPGLSLTKRSDSDVVPAGTTFTWTIEYFNNSANDDTGVFVTDLLPTGVNLVNAFHKWNATTTSNDGSLPTGDVNLLTDAAATPHVTVSLVGGRTQIEVVIADSDDSPTAGLRGADLSLLEGGTITLEVVADPALVSSGTVLFNEAQGCYENPVNDFCLTASDIVTVQKPDLEINKFSSIQDPIPGDEVTYSLIFSNKGLIAAPDVVVTDVLPAGLCFVPGSTSLIPGNWNVPAPTISAGDCMSVSTTLTWTPFSTTVPSGVTAGTLPASSETVTLTYRAMVQAGVSPGVMLPNTAMITTTIDEDDNFPNETDEEVTTPRPDPYVSKTGPTQVDPGATFDWTISYGNLSRIAATSVYMIDTLPDIDASGTADVQLNSIVASNGETVYCHDSITGEPAVTDINNPIPDGWVTNCFTTGYKPTYVLIVVGNLAAQAGPFNVILSAQAIDPDTGLEIPAGTELLNTVDIEADDDEDPDNNMSTASTKTPGFDLFIEKSGSIEGAFPGTTAGSSLVYTIRFGNQGTEPICGVVIDDMLPAELAAGSPAHDFASLSLTDAQGNDINPIDPMGNPVTTSVSVAFSDLGGGSLQWEIGTPSADVCLPPRSETTFSIFVSINDDVADSTTIENCIHVDQTTLPIANEDVRDNNDDCSSVISYRADVSASKQGYSCGPDDDCGTATPGAGDDNNSSETNPGDLVQYEISYNNSGNTAAEDAIITETIPAGTCYIIGSAEAEQPAGTALEFSDDGGFTWTYAPVGTAGDSDCDVSNFRLVFGSPIPAPATFWSQGSEADFSMNTLSNLEIITNTSGQSSVSLLSETMNLTNSALTEENGFGDAAQSEVTVMRQLIGSDSKKKFVWTEGDDVNDLSANVFFWSEDMPVGSAIRISDPLLEGTNIYERNFHTFVDASDQAHVLWIQADSAGGSATKVYYWNESMPAEMPQLLSIGAVSSGNSIHLKAELSNQDVIHATWSERSADGEGRNTYYWNSSANATIRISNPALTVQGQNANSSWEPLLQVGSNGVAHIAWAEAVMEGNANSAMDMFYWNSSMAAETATPISSAASKGNPYNREILVDSLGRAHVTWTELDPTTGVLGTPNDEGYDMFYWRSDFGASASVTLSDHALTERSGGVGAEGLEGIHRIERTLDTNNNIHIAWAEDTGTTEATDLFYWSSASLPATAPTRITNQAITQGLVTEHVIKTDSIGRAHIAFIEAGSAYYWNSSLTADSPISLIPAVSTPGLSNLFSGNLPSIRPTTLSEGDRAGRFNNALIIDQATNMAQVLFTAGNRTSLFTEFNDVYIWNETVAPTGGGVLMSDLVATEGFVSPANGFASFSPNNALNVAWIETTSDEGGDMFFWNSDLAIGSPYRITNTAESQGSASIQNSYGGFIQYDCDGNAVVNWHEGTAAEGNNAFRWESIRGENSTFDLNGSTAANGAIYSIKSETAADGCVYTMWSEDSPTASEGVDFFVYPFSPASGTMTTVPITNTSSGNLVTWSNFIFDAEIPDGASLTFDVLDSTGAPVSGFQGLTSASGIISLASIPVTAPTNELMVRVNYTPGQGCASKVTPKLNSMTVTFVTDELPSFSFQVEVQDSGFAGTTIDNTVCIDTSTPEINAANNCGVDSLQLLLANLNLMKSVDKAAALPGSMEVLTYTIDYCNDGPNTAVAPVITDTLPALFDINALSLPPACIYAAGPRTVTCNVADLTIGQCGQVVFNGTLSNAATGGELLLNQACVDALTHDPDIGDNCDTDSTTVGSLANVRITKTSATTTTGLGSQVIYTLAYENNGNGAAVDVYIEDTFDTAEFSFVSATQTSQTGTGTSPALICAPGVAGQVICSADGTIPNGVTLAPTDGGTIQLTLMVLNNVQLLVNANNGDVLRNNTMINTSSPQTNVNDDADLHDVTVLPAGLASLSGFVFLDEDEDAAFDSGDDRYLDGFSTFLYGFDIYGNIVGPNPTLFPAEYNSTMNEILPSLIANGIVPSGTSVADIATLTNYTAVAPQITGAGGTMGAYGFGGLNPASVAFNGSSYNILEVDITGYRSTGSNAGQANSMINDMNVVSPGHGIGTTEAGPDVNVIRGIQLNEGMNSVENNFGEKLGKIGNFVWSDSNGDGVFDMGEQPIQSIEVRIYRDVNPGDGPYDAAVDTLVDFTFTDVNGEYLFEDLLLDDDGGDGDFDYFVVVVDSLNILDGALNTSGAPGVNNNSQDASGYAVTLTEAAPENLTADFGYAFPASLGNFVWWDLNEDGIQDSGEPGIAGVTVNLRRTADDSLVTSAMTDGMGGYLFDNLAPDTYYVEFVPPATATWTTSPSDQGGNDVFDSDADGMMRTPDITLIPDEENLTVDAGFYVPGMLPASLGDFVWFDNDNDGVQDLGELGVPGTTVNLYTDGGTLLSTTLTDNTGAYFFGGLAPGDYVVEFVPPTGYILTPQDQGINDAADSDANTSTGRTETITLGNGEFNQDIDAGLDAPGIMVSSISGNVWIDSMTNGQREGTEANVPGVTVNLFLSDGTLVGTALTDIDGNYVFPNLLPGDYYVEFIQPTGFDFTLQNLGGNDTSDSDANRFTGRTGIINLGPNENIPNNDVGLIEEETANFVPASLGDVVWNDLNQNGIFDSNEMGIDGVVVNLYDLGGNLIGTETTSGGGLYMFAGLMPGDYIVEFITPMGFTISPQGSGSDTTVDSDASPTGRTGVITLEAGENNNTIDAGIYEGTCPNLSVTSPLRVVWNGFLEQINIVSMFNRCDADESVTLTLFDDAGNVQDVLPVGLAANSQFDVVLNQLNGFAADSYGVVEIAFPNSGCVNGHTSYYKMNETTAGEDHPEVEFSITMPFQDANVGTTYATFNTIQPSLNPAEANNLVANWLQITNLDSSAQTFTKNLYDAAGVLVDTETVTIPAGGRFDLQAGHVNPGPGNVGLVEVIPTNPGAEYIAQVFRYGQNTAANMVPSEYNFALGFQNRSGETGCQYLFLATGGNADNWLVLANTDSMAESVNIEVFDQFSGSQGTLTANLPAFGQSHIDISQFLVPGNGGFVEVCPTSGKSIIAESMFYYRTPSTGSVEASYGSLGILGQCGTDFASYNSFWWQRNWLRLLTPGDTTVDVTIRVFDQTGILIAEVPSWVFPGQVANIDLHGPLFNLENDTYGYIEIEVHPETPGEVISQVATFRLGEDGTFDLATSH